MAGGGPRRVVVTGMGAVTALGNDVAATWAGLVAGHSGIRRIQAYDPSRLTSQIAGEVRDFDASGVMDRKDLRRTDRFIQLALVATRQAMDQAGLPARLEGGLAERTGTILATGLGGVSTMFANVIAFAERGPDRIGPFMIPMGIPNMAAGQIPMSFGPLGPSFATVSACASSGHALGEAFETIRRGDADLMLAGGAEAALHLVGYGATADGYHLTLPAPGGAGAVRAARRALEKAGLAASELDHVNAHATSTPEGDKTELQAIATILHGTSKRVSVTANKSMLGHTLGAAGAIEAIATIQTIREGCVPPTINLDDPEEGAEGLDLTPNVARQQDVRIALSNSFGFGGQNTALVFRRWEP